jgi:hypothetical protein
MRSWAYKTASSAISLAIGAGAVLAVTEIGRHPASVPLPPVAGPPPSRPVPVTTAPGGRAAPVPDGTPAAQPVLAADDRPSQAPPRQASRPVPPSARPSPHPPPSPSQPAPSAGPSPSSSCTASVTLLSLGVCAQIQLGG